jgi:hypothetical protein
VIAGLALLLVPALAGGADVAKTRFSGHVTGDPTSQIRFTRVGHRRIAEFVVAKLPESCDGSPRRSTRLPLGGIPMRTQPTQTPNRFHKVRTVYVRPRPDVSEKLDSDVSGRFTRSGVSGQLEITETFYNVVAGIPSDQPFATCTTGKLGWSAAPRG